MYHRRCDVRIPLLDPFEGGGPIDVVVPAVGTLDDHFYPDDRVLAAGHQFHPIQDIMRTRCGLAGAGWADQHLVQVTSGRIRWVTMSVLLIESPQVVGETDRQHLPERRGATDRFDVEGLQREPLAGLPLVNPQDVALVRSLPFGGKSHRTR